MLFDLDAILFIGFLVINLWLGLSSSRGITTLREYSIGNKDFSTATIAYTIIATWIGGSFFYTTISEVYSRGIYFVIALLFDAFTFVIIGYYFAPRLSEFIGKMSIADAMTSVYGEKVGFVTAIAGLIGISGSIAVQLKLSGLMFNYALGIPEIYGVIISGLVITIYSALGGIRSVTFTDIIQFQRSGNRRCMIYTLVLLTHSMSFPATAGI